MTADCRKRAFKIQDVTPSCYKPARVMAKHNVFDERITLGVLGSKCLSVKLSCCLFKGF